MHLLGVALAGSVCWLLYEVLTGESEPVTDPDIPSTNPVDHPIKESKAVPIDDPEPNDPDEYKPDFVPDEKEEKEETENDPQPDPVEETEDLKDDETE